MNQQEKLRQKLYEGQSSVVIWRIKLKFEPIDIRTSNIDKYGSRP